MDCPLQDCDYTGTLREVERHRTSEHGGPRWEIVWDLPPGEPDAQLPE